MAHINFVSGFSGGSDSKESAYNAGDPGSIPGFDPLEKGMATNSSILAWKKSHGRGAWPAIVYGVTKSWGMIEWLSFHY